ncbi:hypothetical protein Acr_00g0005320 [Actinidia rufa]|uniref:Uncharacterized protein n=1 Tax=Actinidia rufa TaxID=165716 RepID=A0A7J0D942_9ERIC|nr:hypothetical protein Acr_00g0005320 [Actinidia rufa]
MVIKTQALADFIVEFTYDVALEPKMTLPEDLFSKLLQVYGDYLTKDLRIVAYLDKVKAMSMKIKKFKIRQILREENKKADALTNLASIFEFISNRSIPLELLPSPRIDIAKAVSQTIIDLMWMDDIITYIKDGKLPSNKLQAFFSSNLAISNHFSSPDHLQENGQVEVTNKIVLRNLKARSEDLPSILWAYHTISRIPTGEMPYSIVYGTESVILVEIGMPSYKPSNFDNNINEVELRLNLDLFDEKRERAEVRQDAYKHQVAKYYN